MKLLSILFFALLGIIGFASAGDKERCAAERPEVYKAINAFCPKRDLVVPSKYAVNGKRGGGKYAKVWISSSLLSTCNPPQWVPYGACYSQLYKMCNDYQNVKWFGKKLCQMWRIDYNTKYIGYDGYVVLTGHGRNGLDIAKRQDDGEAHPEWANPELAV